MKIEYGVICDLVRREDSGKLLVVGLYAADILVPEIPHITPVTLVVWAMPATIGKTSIEVKAELNAKQIVTGLIEMDIQLLKRSIIAFPNIPLNITEAGRLQFFVKSDEDWQSVWDGECALNAHLI